MKMNAYFQNRLITEGVALVSFYQFLYVAIVLSLSHATSLAEDQKKSNSVSQFADAPQLMGHRFLTLNTIVRVHQIEVTRDVAHGPDEVEGIHVCQGNIWSQYAVDNGDGEGSICYPYYPSREHFCKPAQSQEDRIDCVNLDGWTVDFLAARIPGRRKVDGELWRSRQGVGPIETVLDMGIERGTKSMLATTAAHFDDGFARNGFAWVSDPAAYQPSRNRSLMKRINQKGTRLQDVPTSISQLPSEDQILIRNRYPQLVSAAQPIPSMKAAKL
jgi:Domain of Unknown Function with PDB structure (DUF3863)/Domain of Unknown Function with PDB structure (DUF3864)